MKTEEETFTCTACGEELPLSDLHVSHDAGDDFDYCDNCFEQMSCSEVWDARQGTEDCETENDFMGFAEGKGRAAWWDGERYVKVDEDGVVILYRYDDDGEKWVRM